MKVKLDQSDLISAITTYLGTMGINTNSKNINLTFRGSRTNRFGISEPYAEVNITEVETKSIIPEKFKQLDLDL